MGKKILKKTGVCCLSASFVAGMALSGTTFVNAEETSGVEADIYPVPQNESYSSKEGMNVPESVNIVLHGNQEEATVPKLEEILYENGIRYEVSDTIREDVSNLIISSKADHCEVCAEMKSDALKQKEGYVLVSSDDDNAKGDIKIIGADSDGAYYGVMTLDQIIKQKTADNKMAEVTVEDYPEIGMRGFIEGFYGYPWTHEERMSLMKDTAKYKMNTYIYAPKDDPYHRANWKALYPEDKAKEIAELAQAGHDNNFNFCWTIHPGASLQFNDTDYQALIKKFEQLYSLGVRQFGVLFDDTDDWYNGQKQADFINKIDTEFVKAKGDVQPMVVVAARYNSAWGPSMGSYFKPYMATLHDDIQIMWTGAATMSNISKSVYEWPKQQTGIDRDLAVWWNYPVNDYCDSRLVMAPLHNLNPDLDNVTGFFSNPMQQADASKVALYGIANYTWNTDNFDYMASWERSIEELVPEASTAYKHFAEDTSYLKDDGGTSGPFVYNESWNSTALIDALKATIVADTSIKQTSSELKAKYQMIIEDADELLANMKNKNLLEESMPFLKSYRALGVAGVHAMNALVAAENGELETWLNENNASREALQEMSTYVVTSLEGSGTNDSIVAVGEQYLRPAVETSLNAASKTISKKILVEKNAEVYKNKETVDATIETDGGKFTIRDVKTTLHANENITFAMPKAMQVSKIELQATPLNDLQIETSLNGIEWTKANAVVEGSSLIVNDQTSATFVRVVNTKAGDVELSVGALAISPVYKANPSVSQNIGVYQTNKIENALDGKFTTKYWSDKALSAGHYIQVDLGKVMPLYDVTGYFGGSDYLMYGKFEVSSDGIAWQDLGKLTYTAKSVGGQNMQLNEINANGQMVRYFRYMVTAAQNNWLQLFEIEINKLATSGDDVVTLFDSNMTGALAKMADGDMTTSFVADEVAEGDYVSYQLTRTTTFADLMVLQSKESICNANVSVKGTDGNWSEIGTLDKQLTTLPVNKTVTEVRFDFFADQPAPEIFEIITSEKQREDTSFVKGILNSAITKTKAIPEETMNTLAPAVQEMLKTCLAEAERVYANANATSEQIMNAWTQLANALHYINFKADKAMLNELIMSCMDINTDDYQTGVEEFTAALANAKLVNEDANALQERIDAAYNRLLNAKNGLGVTAVDKELLAKLVDSVRSAIDNPSKYHNDSNWEAFVVAYNNAVAVMDNENATQSEVSASFANLASAYENIRLLPDEALLQQLEDFMNAADALDVNLYSEEDFAYVMQVRTLASDLYNAPDFTTEQYDNVVKEMEIAWAIIRDNKLEVPDVTEPEGPTTPDVPTTPEEPGETDQPSDTEAPNNPTNVEGTTKPTTGDNTNMMLYTIMLGGACIATIAAKKRLRKEN